MSSRSDSIAAFYTDEATALRRSVRRAITGSEELIEDACSFAWYQLLQHDEIQLDSAGFGWLLVVAKREAYRLSERNRRECPAGASHDLPHRAAVAVAQGWEQLDRRDERQDRRELLLALPERKRKLVVLHAAGFTYAEIVRLTGDTLRTVERQILRGKRQLRRLTREAGR